MNFWISLFNKKQEKEENGVPNQVQEIKNKNNSPLPVSSYEKIPDKQPLIQREKESVEGKTEEPAPWRTFSIFIISTFADMVKGYNEKAVA